MKISNYIRRGDVAFAAIVMGATTIKEVGSALYLSKLFNTSSAAEAEASRIVNHMLKLGRVVRDEQGKLRAK